MQFLLWEGPKMTAPETPKVIWDHEIMANPEPPATWLWDGFLARGSMTLLTGLWKAGKTTLLALLLARRKQGGALAGLDVQPGKTVVVTEENSSKWAERARQYDFGGQVCFIPRPFLSIPRPDQWVSLLAQILELRTRHGIDLVVLDPLAPLLRSENNPRAMLETLLPLGLLTRHGMAVLAMHHPRKGQPALGQAARGSGALLGHVDISIEMRHPGGDPLTRRRRLLALSRYSQTPRQLLIELDPAGTDYAVVPGDAADGFQANWNVLCMIFEDAPQKLTRQDVLGEWPADFDRPSPTNLRRWLNRAVQRGLLACEGSGRKADPFRYWFPATEALWKQNLFYDVIEKQTKELGLPFQSLTERKRLRGEQLHFEKGVAESLEDSDECGEPSLTDEEEKVVPTPGSAGLRVTPPGASRPVIRQAPSDTKAPTATDETRMEHR
jgi:hypothetical protein